MNINKNIFAYVRYLVLSCIILFLISCDGSNGHASGGNTPTGISKLTLTAVGPTTIAKNTQLLLNTDELLTDGTVKKNIDATYSVADSKILSVDIYGIVTGVSVGTSTVTAKAPDGETVSIQITVTNVTLTGLNLTAKDVLLAKGTTTILSAIGTFSDGTTQDLSNQVSWGTSNDGIVSTSGNQLLVLGYGTTILTAGPFPKFRTQNKRLAPLYH